jgi:hypothetical protein
MLLTLKIQHKKQMERKMDGTIQSSPDDKMIFAEAPQENQGNISTGHTNNDWFAALKSVIGIA